MSLESNKASHSLRILVGTILGFLVGTTVGNFWGAIPFFAGGFVGGVVGGLVGGTIGLVSGKAKTLYLAFTGKIRASELGNGLCRTLDSPVVEEALQLADNHVELLKRRAQTEVLNTSARTR